MTKQFIDMLFLIAWRTANSTQPGWSVTSIVLLFLRSSLNNENRIMEAVTFVISELERLEIDVRARVQKLLTVLLEREPRTMLPILIRIYRDTAFGECQKKCAGTINYLLLKYFSSTPHTEDIRPAELVILESLLQDKSDWMSVPSVEKFLMSIDSPVTQEILMRHWKRPESKPSDDLSSYLGRLQDTGFLVVLLDHVKNQSEKMPFAVRALATALMLVPRRLNRSLVVPLHNYSDLLLNRMESQGNDKYYVGLLSNVISILSCIPSEEAHAICASISSRICGTQKRKQRALNRPRERDMAGDPRFNDMSDEELVMELLKVARATMGQAEDHLSTYEARRDYARGIGRALYRRGGMAAMHEALDRGVGAMPGQRTIDGFWNGIGDWMG